MARYHFFTLDVFTGRQFGGNPLAVVLDAERLSGEQMQAIGRESVPVALRAAAEFSRLCPDSAVCMTKSLYNRSIWPSAGSARAAAGH